MSAPREIVEDACDLRFGQVGMACVRVRRADAAALCDELDRRVQTAPQMFLRTAVVLDLSHLDSLPDDGMVDALLEAVRSAGMIPVGLAYGTPEMDALAQRMHVPLIAKFRSAYERQGSADASPAPAAAPPAPEPTGVIGPSTSQLHEGQVRSGQQIYARDRDLVITGTVANAAEVIADGSIHVYGTLRGRALAGAQGDENARIFCSDFRAELISIAGQYRVFEKLPDELAGQPVQCWLEDDKLLITRL